LPLFLGLVEDGYATSAPKFGEGHQAHGNRLTTGDVGNRYLFQTLARNETQ
jgi:hypothetical protein